MQTMCAHCSKPLEQNRRLQHEILCLLCEDAWYTAKGRGINEYAKQWKESHNSVGIELKPARRYG